MADIVYATYTREQLDRQYSNFLQEGAEEANDIATARAVRNTDTLGPQRGIVYGPSAGEVFDLYHPGGGVVPAVIYMHGGQWQKGDATNSAVAADTILAHGAALVAAHCTQIPDARIPDMVAQTVSLVRHVRTNAASLGIDPSRICVAGHSSGAHLAASALVKLANEEDLAGIVCGVLVSGNYDMRPLMLSYRAEFMQLDEAETVAMSPLLTLDKPLPPVWFTVGSIESDEFKRQTRSFHDAVAQCGAAELRITDGHNHFNANTGLREAGSPLWHFLAGHLGLVEPASTAAQ
jgi:arylformamidase